MIRNRSCLIALSLIAVLASQATADFVSNFTTTDGDVVITGFSTPAFPLPTATTGPVAFTTTSPTGSYALDIPPVGTLGNVSISGSVTFDSDADGDFSDELPLMIPLTSAGTFVSPGVSSLPSWSGTALLPDFANPFGPGTISGVTLDFLFDVDNTAYPAGAYGSSASTVLTLSGGNLIAMTTPLTTLDNFVGGANGQITLASISDLTVTVSAVPEPSGFLFGGLIGLTGLVFSRKLSTREKN